MRPGQDDIISDDYDMQPKPALGAVCHTVTIAIAAGALSHCQKSIFINSPQLARCAAAVKQAVSVVYETYIPLCFPEASTLITRFKTQDFSRTGGRLEAALGERKGPPASTKLQICGMDVHDGTVEQWIFIAAASLISKNLRRTVSCISAIGLCTSSDIDAQHRRPYTKR